MFSKTDEHKASIVYSVHVHIYVMLTEEGNDLYCAKHAILFKNGCGFDLQSEGVGEQSAQGGTGEVECLTVTGD